MNADLSTHNFLRRIWEKLCSLAPKTPITGFLTMRSLYRDKFGLEIGGPSPTFQKNGPLPIYPLLANIDGTNFSQQTMWTGGIDPNTGYQIQGKVRGQQFLLDATTLTPLADNIYDVVLSCHNIEHIANPLKALGEWSRILKPGGTLTLLAPIRETNFDHRRPIISIAHLIDDLRNNTQEDDLTHLDEILALHDLERDPLAGTPEQFRARSLKNAENRCLHQHVFDLNVLIHALEYCKYKVLYTATTPDAFVIVGQK